MFTYKWKLKDLKNVNKNGLKVFSCFACGGGSTMGYKMSGFEVLGANDIDPVVMNHYVRNHKPKYSFLESIVTFKDNPNLPEELFNLDILDGSPPCSSFSMAGQREKKWGVEKKFREGQEKQVLDDLFFHFIDLAKRLQPKVVIAENVKGLISGNAKGYVKQIFDAYDKAGYETQLFLLNGATMGLPQKRERVFFISRRKDLKLPKIKLSFNEKPIRLIDALDGITDVEKITDNQLQYWMKAKPGESFSKYHPKGSYFNMIKAPKYGPANTLTTKTEMFFHWKEKRTLNLKEWQIIGSYPLDYDFGNYNGKYLIGMSVPPMMMHKVSMEVAKQLFGISYA